MQESHGHVMPLPVKFWPRATTGILWLLLATVCLGSLFPAVRELVDIGETKWLALRVTTVLIAPAFLAVGLTCFAKLHILPRGVTLTLFSLTLRRIPADRIQVISAIRYSYKLDAVDQIALCMRPPEEGLYSYLRRRSGFFLVNLNIDREIFWLDWSPERLRLLRQMYPHAQWLDISKDKMFEKQLNV